MYIISSILIWTSYIILYQFSGKGQLILDKTFDNPLYLTDLNSLLQYDKVWSFFYALIFFSISGLPPLSGFLAKFLIGYNLILDAQYFTIIFLMFFSAFSTFYYVKLIKILFFESSTIKGSRFNYVFDKEDFLFKYCCFTAFFCLSLLFHAFFFMDSWIILSKSIVYNFLF